MKPAIIISLLLCIATTIPYSQARYFSFVNYDDPDYVTENPHVQSGLTPHSIAWSFNVGYAANWHPLTWLSHMLDCTMFGMDPGAHHMTNLLFHILNTLLLFFTLMAMTGAPWKSGFVAGLFALHPMHVESVAWIAERKDVLSTFFWMLTMGAYLRYVKRSTRGRYLLVMLCFTLGLMAKPMLVTLPLVLLLLDFWPLQRHLHLPINIFLRRSIIEKTPLLLLSVASCIITLVAQQKSGAVASVALFPLGLRLSNAICSYGIYTWKMVTPVHLTVFYPSLTAIAWPTFLFSLFYLIAMTALAFKTARKLPFITVGWMWYIITLFPVIGILQVGSQSMADRYSYVPFIGLFILVSWGVAAIASKWRSGRSILATTEIAVLLFMTAMTWKQLHYWKDSGTLFNHALAVSDKNFVAHNNLGLFLKENGKTDEAIAHFAEALRIDNNDKNAHNNLGNSLMELGEVDHAIVQYREALRIKPGYAEARNNLGIAYARLGRLDEAIDQFTKVLLLNSDNERPYNNLGLALVKKGRTADAIGYYTKALFINPGNADSHYNLGCALEELGRRNEAIAHFEEAIRIDPMFNQAHEALLRLRGF